MEILVLLLGILVPPLGAVLRVGISTHFWINLVLTLFGYLPGLAHFMWMMFTDKQLD